MNVVLTTEAKVGLFLKFFKVVPSTNNILNIGLCLYYNVAHATFSCEFNTNIGSNPESCVTI